MPIVRSGGTLTAVTSDPSGIIDAPLTFPQYGTYGSTYGHLGDDTYGQIFATQPNVRTVVETLAEMVAGTNMHAYRRISDLDRERLADHQVIAWLKDPNPSTTRFELLYALILDFLIFANAYLLKVRRGADVMGLVRILPQRCIPVGGLMVSGFQYLAFDGRLFPLDVTDVVHLKDFNPDPLFPLKGLSRLETLRQQLAEDSAAAAYRQAYWTNSARLEGVITRPAGAPRWTPEQKQAFREQWQSRFSGVTNAGQTAVLEDGMTFTPTSFSAEQSEYLPSRKFSAEQVARLYHMPQPSVGILDHATYANVREQHKQLYQDALSPYYTRIEETVEKYLLPEASDQTNVYFEFNINEKLQGAFEEQASAIALLTQRPVFTANEARARLNLPSIKDDPTANQLAQKAGAPPMTPAPAADGQAAELVALTPPPPLVDFLVRQAWARQARAQGGRPAAAFDADKWARELAEDLALAHCLAPSEAARYADRITADTTGLLREGKDAFSPLREVPPCHMLLLP